MSLLLLRIIKPYQGLLNLAQKTAVLTCWRAMARREIASHEIFPDGSSEGIDDVGVYANRELWNNCLPELYRNGMANSILGLERPKMKKQCREQDHRDSIKPSPLLKFRNVRKFEQIPSHILESGKQGVVWTYTLNRRDINLVPWKCPSTKNEPTEERRDAQVNEEGAHFPKLMA